jgi:poly(hydroxyalkanoate) depolymerase family esterase
MAQRTFVRLLRFLVGAAIVFGIVLPAFSEDVYKTFRHGGWIDSRDREYIVHLPAGHDPAAQPLPLVMVLHGCNETNETIKHDTNFDAISDQEGFIVVYPFITSYDGFRNLNCWGFWFPNHIHAGRGEVQDLRGIIKEVIHDYRVDENRIHIAGLSSGAGMTVAAMVAQCDLIASGSPTAGLAYSETASSVSGTCFFPGTFKTTAEVATAMNAEMGPRKRPVPILIVHSVSDCVVNPKASENIRDAWGMVFGADTARPATTTEGVTKSTPWVDSTYNGPDGKVLIETLFVKGLPHGWYGGRDGQYAFSHAPNTAQLAWNFFKAHPKGPSIAPPAVTISSAASTDGKAIKVKGEVRSNDAPERLKVTVELLGLSPQAPRDAQLDGARPSYEFTSPENLKNDCYYRPRVIATNSVGQSVVLGEPVPLGHPSAQPPRVMIDPVRPDSEQLFLSGSASDVLGVASVDVRIDGGKWLPAELSGTIWTYRRPSLAEGNHAIDARAMNKAALDAMASQSVTISPPYDAKQLSNINAHVVASRIRMYSGGFGSADKGYMELLRQYGTLQEFALYRARHTNDWYADPANIPRVATGSGASTQDALRPIPQPASRALSPRLRALLRELQEELRHEEMGSTSAFDQGDGCPGCGSRVGMR